MKMIQMKVNGAEQSFNGKPEMPYSGICATFGADGIEVCG
jgi:hypothetical protein